MRICRGELDAAATELTRWRVRGLPEQFGLPAIAAAEAALAEAHGRIDDAVASAVRSWATAMDSGRAIWALIAGVDTARIALAAGDESLLARVHADTVAVPADQAVLHGPAADLVRAMAERDPERAKAAATAFRHRGNIVGELGGWEEAAVAAAAIGNADQARDCAARATALAESLGATTVTRRVAARLRDLRVRVGPPRRRARPTHGWGSHPDGTAGGRTDGTGSDEPADRGAAVPLAADRADPRLALPAQARPADPRGARGDGGPPPRLVERDRGWETTVANVFHRSPGQTASYVGRSSHRAAGTARGPWEVAPLRAGAGPVGVGRRSRAARRPPALSAGTVRGEGEDPEAHDRDDRGTDRRVQAVLEGVQDHGHDERAGELQDLAPAAGGGRGVERGGGGVGAGHEALSSGSRVGAR